MPRSKPGGSQNTAGAVKEIPLRPDASRAREIAITRIVPNPQNLRGDDLWESDEEQDATVNSMREIGLIQALVVCTRDAHLREYPQDADAVAGADFIVMAGHRRLAAASLAGLTEVKVDVQDDQVKHLDLLMLEENLKRKALNVFQEGEGYRRLQGKGATHAQIGKQVGKSKSHITKRIALLALPKDAQQAIHEKRLGVDAAYNLLVALDGQPERVLDAAEIMRSRSVIAQDAVNILLGGSARTDYDSTPAPSTPPEPVLPEPDATPTVPPSRTAEPEPNPPHPEPALVPTAVTAATLEDPASTEPVLAEPAATPASEAEAGEAKTLEPARVATPAVTAEQEGRAQANAARNEHCRQLVIDYDKPATDPQSTRVAVTALIHATPPALTRAHGWLKDADQADAAAMGANSYRDALLVRGDATLIARLAYAVALAEDELRASNRSRNWDYRDVAYLTHLIEAGYEPAEWERRHLG
ncbi:hypothetical protein HY68_36730 [Streptomyces sp. AcH 505]|uniref:ParB/RepB/Spo0J family partition protein n=1 Tax=Streptomyces sp. AcH 505 TaxID=352211 RepID=UPI0005920928|nr:hypothetical protein HY68_36730 [Streptomyces sp. AcH 505]